MDLGIQGKVAAVTAASRGLGFATARALALEGCRLAIAARGGEGLRRAAAELLRMTGAEVLAHRADVARPEEARGFIEAAAAKLGPPDILVVNAGGPPPGGALERDLDAWRAASELTLFSAVELCRAAVPSMRSRRFGRVVFITSLAARQPIAGLALSNALRAGVLGYAKTLSDEVARDGVTVNCVCPGYTRTERLAELAAEVARARAVSPEEVYAGWERLAAMGRLGRPEELGEVVAFLASERASFVTGVALTVDGGASRSLF